MAVEVDIDLRATVLVVVGTGVGDLVTGNDDAALNVGRTPLCAAEGKGLGGCARRIRLGRQTKLQVGGLAQNPLGLSGILHARQLHYDTVGTLTLHQRLSHPQLIDPVTHGSQVLLHRVVANRSHFGLGQGQLQYSLILELGIGSHKLVVLAGNQATGFTALVFVGKAELQGVALGRQTAIANPLRAHQAPQLTLVDIDPRLDGLVHVDLQQEVHTTGQVQTQCHGASPNCRQPVRRGLRQVLRHNIARAERVTDNILRLQLITAINQTHQAGAAVGTQFGALGRQIGCSQRLLDAVKISLIDDLSGAGAGDLNGRVVGIKVRQRIDHAQCKHGHDQQVFPEGITVEHIRA